MKLFYKHYLWVAVPLFMLIYFKNATTIKVFFTIEYFVQDKKSAKYNARLKLDKMCAY